MEKQETRVDVTNGSKTTQMRGFAYADLVATGLWRQDRVWGKTLCRIIVTVPKLGIQFAWIPSEGFEQQLLTSWLDAERRNDNFVFKNPHFKKQRPGQLAKKIDFLLQVVDTYKRAYKSAPVE